MQHATMQHHAINEGRKRFKGLEGAAIEHAFTIADQAQGLFETINLLKIERNSLLEHSRKIEAYAKDRIRESLAALESEQSLRIAEQKKNQQLSDKVFCLTQNLNASRTRAAAFRAQLLAGHKTRGTNPEPIQGARRRVDTIEDAAASLRALAAQMPSNPDAQP